MFFILFSLQSGFATCSPLSVKSGDRFIPTRAGSNWSINFHYANASHVLSFRASCLNVVKTLCEMQLRKTARHVSYSFILQENCWSPSQNQRSKDASADTGKGKVLVFCRPPVDLFCVLNIPCVYYEYKKSRSCSMCIK